MSLFDNDRIQYSGKRYGKPEIDLKVHPLDFLQRLAKFRPEIESFTFVAYNVQEGKYGSTRGDKTKITVAASRVLEDGLLAIEQAANEGLDVVVSSEVNTKDGPRHLQLIDMALPGHDWVLEALKGDDTFMEAFENATDMLLWQFAFYRSGRSFHVYGTRLLTQEEWAEFNATLLTLPGVEIENEAGNMGYNGPAIDFRWIGHSFLRGCGALRLSATDEQYLQIPVLASPLPPALRDSAPTPEILF